ncbi:hypothetical protein TWF102_002368 [Orbilia oligospora]|uniref:Uncharacterized protein n=1 Tax=Orbilia oligospora TaxID=2813651 RepID=A0A7C8NGR9_ORBOL|nr:hypothetical protein TWF102_002368 [Orbilia oligospora]
MSISLSGFKEGGLSIYKGFRSASVNKVIEVWVDYNSRSIKTTIYDRPLSPIIVISRYSGRIEAHIAARNVWRISDHGSLSPSVRNNVSMDISIEIISKHSNVNDVPGKEVMIRFEVPNGASRILSVY